MAKRKSKGFVRKPKEAMSDLPAVLAKAGARVGGGLAAKAGSNLLAKHVPQVPRKLHGPGMLALSILGEAFISEPHAQAAFQGMGVAAGMQLADEFIPEAVKSKIGLAGLGAIEVDASFDWDELAQVANDDAPLDTKALGAFKENPYWDQDFESEKLGDFMKVSM